MIHFLAVVVLHVFFPVLICVSAMVSNPVLMADIFSIALRFWPS
jgi:hypothetical protein